MMNETGGYIICMGHSESMTPLKINLTPWSHADIPPFIEFQLDRLLSQADSVAKEQTIRAKLTLLENPPGTSVQKPFMFTDRTDPMTESEVENLTALVIRDMQKTFVTVEAVNRWREGESPLVLVTFGDKAI